MPRSHEDRFNPAINEGQGCGPKTRRLERNRDEDLNGWSCKMWPCRHSPGRCKKSWITWELINLVNNGINYQPQLVTPDFWTINSTSMITFAGSNQLEILARSWHTTLNTRSREALLREKRLTPLTPAAQFLGFVELLLPYRKRVTTCGMPLIIILKLWTWKITFQSNIKPERCLCK